MPLCLVLLCRYEENHRYTITPMCHIPTFSIFHSENYSVNSQSITLSIARSKAFPATPCAQRINGNGYDGLITTGNIDNDALGRLAILNDAQCDGDIA